MTEWLLLTPDQRRSTLSLVEYERAIIPKAVEKDWWVTLTLSALFKGAFGQHMVFKGGTSLSKCWKLISRFSEDVDIALAPEAFGMTYLANPTAGQVNRLKRAGCAFTSHELRADVELQLSNLGVPIGTVNVVAAPVPPDRPDTDPQTLLVQYPSLYPPHPYIADEVKIEVSVRSLMVPHSPATLQSLLHDTLNPEVYTETPFTIEVVDPRKTFIEKIFLLHEEFGKPDVTRIRSQRMSRHLYDLCNMAGTPVETEALADRALYAALITHRETYQRIPWVNYQSLRHQTIAFVPPAAVLELYRADYATMREEMIYGEAASFEQLIETLEATQARIRSIE